MCEHQYIHCSTLPVSKKNKYTVVTTERVSNISTQDLKEHVLFSVASSNTSVLSPS